MVPGLDDTLVSDVSLPNSNRRFLVSVSYSIPGKPILTLKTRCKVAGRVTDWKFEGWGMVITTSISPFMRFLGIELWLSGLPG